MAGPRGKRTKHYNPISALQESKVTRLEGGGKATMAAAKAAAKVARHSGTAVQTWTNPVTGKTTTTHHAPKKPWHP